MIAVLCEDCDTDMRIVTHEDCDYGYNLLLEDCDYGHILFIN